MKIKYLKEVKNLQELKTLYFKLSKENHPDHGGNHEIMKIINNEYDYLKKILKNKKAEDGETIINETYESMKNFKDLIEDLLQYPNIIIDIIGSWVWISGIGTYNIKDDILYSKYNMRYSKPKKSFYWFNGIAGTKKRKATGKFEENKNIFGVVTFKSKDILQLT